eukprot:scaffold92088_cov43-Attheya_sp.AAC.1
MPPKKGKNKKKGGGAKEKVADDDDWDILLAAEAQNEEVQTAPKEEAAKEEETATPHDDAGADAAAAFLAAQGIDTTDGGGGGADKKKKKKKKKGAGGGGDSNDKAPMSKAGKLVAERMRLQREEEERIRAAEEAEAERIAELEAADEAERKRIEDEKERKKQKQKEKIERQKREGTYLTKAQKEKKRLAEQRLEAMRAAGMIPTIAMDGQKPKKEKIVHGNKKKDRDEDNEEKATVKEVAPPTEVPAEKELKSTEEDAKKEDSGDDWEAAADDSGDDWDADSDSDAGGKFDDLEKKLKEASINENDDEDLIEAEKRREKERLRILGLERAERERIEAEKRDKFLAEQELVSRQEQEKDQKREEGKKKRMEQEKANIAARTRDDLRCPIVVIMGHVDTGKTKLLDKIRKTNVQEGEAGGITQQIGATFFEKKTLLQQTARLNETEKFDLQVPGMLVIDTPGHESFTNLRSRGSSLCDVAILVVDLMHGLEQQTIESLNMLRKRNTPFVVALNKIDRCYAWKTCKDSPIRDALKEQPEGTLQEFRTRTSEAKVQLMEQGINSNIYWEMGDDDWLNSDFVPLVPTSAITGEGVQDVLMLLCQMAQRKLWQKMMWCANLQATVLEVKAIDGLGMTVDVLVVNGYLKEGDKAVFCTLDGPVVAEIRGLLTPPPSREMRIKSEYIHHKQVKGALGVKIIGNGLEKVMAGTPVMVVGPDDEEEDIKAEVMSDLTSLQDKLSMDNKGVMVYASTLGALEALLQFLREETKPPIPVSQIGIGTVHKRDITKISVMNEKGCSEYATVLAFDVPIDKDAREHATEMNVRVFTADIIYHLFDQFTRFMEELTEKRREEAAA